MKCGKPPYRSWIAMMLIFTTGINYCFRSFFPVALIAMLDKEVKVKLDNGTQISKPPPDYGPRYSWTSFQEGQLIGGYFYGYTVGSLFGGPISEYFGPYWTVLVSTTLCALLTALSVPLVMDSWVPLFVCRVIVGLLGGWTYPSLQCLIGRWSPPKEKGKFVSCLMGNVLGTVITQAVTGWVVAILGWNWGFFWTGFATVGFLFLWALIVADSPKASWFCSEEESDYILECQAGTVKAGKSKPPLRQMATSVPFLVLVATQFGNLWGLYMLLTILPKFMAEVLKFNLKKVGFLAATPSLSRLVCGFIFGALGDYLYKKEILSKVMIRKGFTIFSHILPGCLLFLFMAVGDTVWLAVALLDLVMGFNGAAVITCLLNPQDLAPNYAGTQFGIMSFTGSMPGFIVPSLVAEVTKYESEMPQWAIVFGISGGVYAGCGILFILFGSVELQPWNEKADEPAPAPKAAA